jgi:hypothetical protein
LFFAGGAASNAIGKMAENSVAAARNLTLNTAETFRGAITGLTRKPDFLTSSSIIEVKNTNYQYLSGQIRDYAAEAQLSGRTFELILRGGANPTKASQQLLDFMNEPGANRVLTWMDY